LNDVPQVLIGVAAKVGEKTSFPGKVNKLGFDYVARAQVASCHDAGP
jgi:hypothetical protein